jgi:hypothetical protein
VILVVGAREEGLDHLPEATDAGDSIEFGSLPDTLEFVSRLETYDVEESSCQLSSDGNRSEALL